MFVNKISKMYQDYNPNGPTRFVIMYDDNKHPYIQEVGKFNQKDMQLDNTMLSCSYKNEKGVYEEFTVFRKIYDLFKTVEECEKHYNKTHGIIVIETIKDVVKCLRTQNYNVIKQKNKNIYIINKIGGMDSIEFGENVADFNITFYNKNQKIQTYIKNADSLYKFITSLTC